MTSDLVWAQRRYDCGLYDCKVVRAGDKGKMTVTLIGLRNYLLHEESVKTDQLDLDKWRRRCEEVISNVDLRTIERR